jgi:hypothetical protein
MFKNVSEYLTKLKKELGQSVDRSLIQDALSDAETHLRNALEEELSENPNVSEAKLLTPLIEKYGTPSEVASAYRAMEPHITSAPGRLYRPGKRSFLGKFFSVLTESSAWGAFVYLVFAFIPAVIFGGWALFAGLASASMLVFIIGLPLFGGYLLSLRGIALLEGRIIEALLGVRMPQRPLFFKKGLGWRDKFMALVRDPYSWKALVYFVLLLPLGFIYTALFSLLFTFSLIFILSPVLELVFRLPLDLVGDNVFTPLWLLPFVCLGGLLLLPLTFHLAKLFGRVHGRFAKSMLVRK